VKILHVICSLDPKLGGPPVVASRLAASQAALGHAVSILAHETYRSGESVERARAALGAIPGMDRVAIELLPSATRAERLYAPGAARAFRARADRPDVLHLHGVWEPLLLRAGAYARRAGVPYLVAPHGMLDPWTLAQRRLKKRIALALAFRRMLNGASAFHALNEDEARALREFRFRPPAPVIPNGVFLEELSPLPPAGEFGASRPEIGARPYALFLGRIHFKKGLDLLADAFALLAPQLPQARLVVAGPDDGYLPKLRAQLGRLGLNGRVVVVGPLYGRDKLAALAGAACFVLPSRQEGFSIAITEALACGVPSVVSRECHFPEVATSGAGVEVALEASSIAEGLRPFLSSPRPPDRRGGPGPALVRERYTWPAIARRSLEVYSGVLAR